LLNVAHQLAVTPQLIVLSPTGSSGQFAATWGGLTPDGFDIHLRNVTGANIAGTVKVDWIVLG
jgi:hypothetical protein